MSEPLSPDDLRERLQRLMAEHGLSQRGWAKKAGVSDSALRAFINGDTKSLNVRTMQALADALELPLNHLFYADDESSQPAVIKDEQVINQSNIIPLPNSGQQIPVYASAQGGRDGAVIMSAEPIEWIYFFGPLAAVGGAFAVYIIGDSMEPAYSQGDQVFVHPHRPPQRGSDAVFIAQPEDGDDGMRALVKRLVSWTPKHWKVAEFTPEYREFELDRAIWSKALKIEGKRNGN